MAANLLKDENTKLRTKVHILESELSKKEKLVDDLLLQQDTSSYQLAVNNNGNGVGSAKNGNGGAAQKLKLESHLATNLKRKIRELQTEVASKTNEVEALKRHIKSTKIAEIEVEMKLYIDECTRLRSQLEEVIRSKDTFADPQEVRIIEERFQQQEMVIAGLRNENNEILLAFSQKDQEIMQLKEIIERSKKNGSKDAGKLKQAVKNKNREMVRLRGELNIQKMQNEEYRAKIEDMVKQRNNLNTSNVQYGGRPSTSHYTAPQT